VGSEARMRDEVRTKATGAVSACDGLSILVTGASRGIGRTVAEGLAAAGANVTLAARSQDALGEVAGGIAASGGAAEVAVADLTGPEAARDAVAQALDRFGALDGAFVNAGVSVDVPAFDLSEEDWRRVLDVNLSGAFFTSQAAGRAMRGRGGSIVFTSSTYAHVASPLRSVYAVSKAGVAHLARQLALEWAPEGIRVNAVGPTATLTDLNRERLSQPANRDAAVAKIPLGRLLEPEDLIGAVAFLLGRDSAMITGHSLLVDGGFTIQ
jgi:NAD(P)-dependent dehydrogenase (short-subunit alcohol dehydrogenase family)